MRNTVQFANGKGHSAIRQLQTNFFTHFAQRPELIRAGEDNCTQHPRGDHTPRPLTFEQRKIRNIHRH
ncbi:Uncharacterised protein [Shigella sonnei]|nr:Uncharacterised protein [Shigella sonnei]